MRIMFLGVVYACGKSFFFGFCLVLTWLLRRVLFSRSRTDLPVAYVNDAARKAAPVSRVALCHPVMDEGYGLPTAAYRQNVLSSARLYAKHAVIPRARGCVRFRRRAASILLTASGVRSLFRSRPHVLCRAERRGHGLVRYKRGSDEKGLQQCQQSPATTRP